MKIVIDARFTRTDHHDGISRYGASLIAATAKIADVSMLVSDVRQLALLPDVPYTLISSPLSPLELFVARKVNATGADVVVCPMQTMGTWGRKYGLILTLHDLIYYEHPAPPGFLPAPVRLLWRLYHKAVWPQRLLLNRADTVATISRTTEAPGGMRLSSSARRSGVIRLSRCSVYLGSPAMPATMVSTFL